MNREGMDRREQVEWKREGVRRTEKVSVIRRTQWGGERGVIKQDMPSSVSYLEYLIRAISRCAYLQGRRH